MNFYVPFSEGYGNLKVKSLLHVPFGFDPHYAQWCV